MILYICKEEKVIYKEEITEEYRRNLIILLEKGDDIQFTMIPEGIQKET